MKIVISNRVFWASVVLMSSAIIGWGVSHAAPSVTPEIRTRRIVVVDESDKAIISLSSPSKSTASILVGNENDAGSVAILSSPKSGPIVMIVAKDKNGRIIGPKKGQDSYTSMSR